MFVAKVLRCPTASAGALAHVPVPVGRPDKHLEALMHEIPDPTHRELGLFRVLAARMERAEGHLSQRYAAMRRVPLAASLCA